jgi:hypothetical protein
MPSTMLTAAAAAITAATAAAAPAYKPYAQDSSWPKGAPKQGSAYSAVGVDHLADGGSEIYVSQRGCSDAVVQPILVFAEDGSLLRSWGKEHIARNTSCTQPLNAAAAGCSKPDRTWGGHGLTVKPAAAGKTEVWITDFYNHTVMAFDPKVGAIISLCHSPSASCIHDHISRAQARVRPDDRMAPVFEGQAAPDARHPWQVRLCGGHRRRPGVRQRGRRRVWPGRCHYM